MGILEADRVAEILQREQLQVVFQPIVTLPQGSVLAYEALSRGPAGSPLERPDLLFAAAREQGLLAELDFACQERALRAALEAGLQRPYSLFVNIEPEVAGEMPPALRELYGEVTSRFEVVIEVTERALTAHPSDLLARVRDLRRLGCGIAVDDVGADERSLAMMAFLQPDVIKLDMSFVQSRPDAHVAEVAHAVNAEAERSEATVLVEGVEEAGHADAGVALGADLAQGWHYGRPGPLPIAAPAAGPSDRLRPSRGPGLPPSPWALVAERPNARISPKRLLYAMTRHLEREAERLGGTAVLLATFEAAAFMTALTRERYARLAPELAFCGALATGLEREPAPGVRGVALQADDPMAREWDVAVVSPHFAAALVALDLGDEGPDSERRFRYVLTYERSLAVAAARSMMARLVA